MAAPTHDSKKRPAAFRFPGLGGHWRAAKGRPYEQVSEILP